MWNKRNLIVFMIIINIIISVFTTSSVWAITCTPEITTDCTCADGSSPPCAAAGEQATFSTANAPDVIIVLDLSGSMDDNPAGGSYIYGSSTSCSSDTSNCYCP